MSKIIEKVVLSKYAPHDRNVSWLDVNHKIPVKKYYINGKWVEVSGGGNGCKCNLPEPSEDNLNDVLGVVAQPTGNFNTIVPTQQIDISTYNQETHQYTLSNVDTQYFVEGAEIYLSTNDSGILPENVSGTVVNENGVLHCLVDTGGGQVDLIYVGENQINVTFTPQINPLYIPYVTVASPIYNYQYGFVNQQSSESCLPEVNAEDVDKVLQVRPVEISSHTNTYEVISETNVEFSQYAKQYDFFNVENIDLFKDDAECVVTINGNEYTGTAHIATLPDVGDTLVLYIYDNQNVFYRFSKIEYGNNPYIKFEIPDRPEVEETYTISLSTIEEIKEYDYEWQKGVSIPVPEKGDADKILAVVEKPSDETGILIPEQELTTPAGGGEVRIPNANISDFVVGANVKATIQVEDNTFYLEGTVTHDDQLDVCELTNPEYGEEALAYILLDSNTLYLGLLEQGEEQITFTVSATIPLLENKYQLQTLRGILIEPNSIIPPSDNTQPKSVYSKIVPGNIYLVPYRINNLAENSDIDTFLPFIIDFDDNDITGSAVLLGIFVSMINSSNMVVLNTISPEINSDTPDVFYLKIYKSSSDEYELSIGDNHSS